MCGSSRPSSFPDATIAEALRTAALAGIDVQLMLSARPSGNRLPDWAGNTYVADIVKAGVRVFLYKKGYLHAKTISIDSESCSIGSANIDIRSFSINYELNAVLYSERLARTLENASSVTSPTALSSMRPPMRRVTRPFDSGTPSRGSSLRCCDATCTDASSRRAGVGVTPAPDELRVPRDARAAMVVENPRRPPRAETDDRAPGRRRRSQRGDDAGRP
jgi:hypothetical protein